MITKRLYSIKELVSQNGGPLPISMAGLYSAIKRGEIICITIGRRKFIPYYELERLLSSSK